MGKGRAGERAASAYAMHGCPQVYLKSKRFNLLHDRTGCLIRKVAKVGHASLHTQCGLLRNDVGIPVLLHYAGHCNPHPKTQHEK